MTQQDLDSLRKFAYDSLGHSIDIKDFSRRYGRKSITWLITAPGKREYYLKSHEHRRHYLVEVTFHNSKDSAVAGEEAPCLVGIRRDQSKSTKVRRHL